MKEKFSHIDQVFSKLIVALRKGWLSKKKNNAPAVASSGILVEFKLLLFRGSPDTISDFWKLGQSYSFFSVLLYNCTSDFVYKIFNTEICFEVGCEYRRLKNFSRFRRADLGSRPTRYSQGTYGIWQPHFLFSMTTSMWLPGTLRNDQVAWKRLLCSFAELLHIFGHIFSNAITWTDSCKLLARRMISINSIKSSSR